MSDSETESYSVSGASFKSRSSISSSSGSMISDPPVLSVCQKKKHGLEAISTLDNTILLVTASSVLSNEAKKPSKLEDHLRRCHPDKRSKDLKYFQILKEKLQKRPTMDRMFASTSQRDDNDLQASYNISLLIAKSDTIGEELILPAVEDVLKIIIPKSASDIIKRIPLTTTFFV
ncbi:SCAN domain-containing protein 3 [Trichonephila inaurata madagascariensis]|uniref:SCAN domain-containing protein 3 n=1 Tax=Trichonephila inaurata madagascariensis TaxID=2747483 RepID=A0A8X6YHX1_9ARAC|nr:SCAN domain-containing protein 3 [Trichonephila inaurata madagascariensis]